MTNRARHSQNDSTQMKTPREFWLVKLKTQSGYKWEAFEEEPIVFSSKIKVLEQVEPSQEAPPQRPPELSWPVVGESYVWECYKPHVAKGLIVTDVTWNGEEWMVECEGLTPAGNGNKYYNDIRRFQEACLPFRKAQPK